MRWYPGRFQSACACVQNSNTGARVRLLEGVLSWSWYNGWRQCIYLAVSHYHKRPWSTTPHVTATALSCNEVTVCPFTYTKYPTSFQKVSIWCKHLMRNIGSRPYHVAVENRHLIEIQQKVTGPHTYLLRVILPLIQPITAQSPPTSAVWNRNSWNDCFSEYPLKSKRKDIMEYVLALMFRTSALPSMNLWKPVSPTPAMPSP